MSRTLVLGTVLLCLTAGESAETPGWTVGLSRARITPESPFWMGGFAARTRPAEGTLQDLWLKVLVLEAADGKLGVIVTADVLGFPKGMYDRLCRALDEQHGLPRSRLLFTASHTHSGPVLQNALYDIYPLDDAQRALITDYSRKLEKTILAKVGEALSSQLPATLEAGDGEASFAVNRRTNREAELEQMVARGVPFQGPSDHSVPVLAVRSPGGKTRAVVFGYAAHTSALNLKEHAYRYSGDYAGFTQADLEKRYPGSQAMFFQGCGSDQSAAPRGTLERCKEMGGQLARSVRAVLERPMQRLDPKLAVAFDLVKLDFERPTREYLKEAVSDGGYRGRWAKRLLKSLDAGGAFPEAYPEYPVQVWRLGAERLWITLGGEVAVDYSLAFKKRYGQGTWVAGYANDVMAYIPSRRVHEEGGYQAGAFPVYGLPAVRWCADIEERITSCVERLVRTVQ